jgi:hypothetical protein
MIKGQLAFKPGTILLLVFIAVFGLFVYNWASSSVGETGNQTIEDQAEALECSRLSVEFLNFRQESNFTSVSFQFNQPVETANVNFRGKENKSVEIQRLKEGSMRTAEANGTGYSNVYISTEGCGKVFSYK